MLGIYLLHVNRKRLEEGELQRSGLQKKDRSRMGSGGPWKRSLLG